MESRSTGRPSAAPSVVAVRGPQQRQLAAAAPGVPGVPGVPGFPGDPQTSGLGRPSQPGVTVVVADTHATMLLHATPDKRGLGQPAGTPLGGDMIEG